MTTLTNIESTVLPITLRGREIKTTLVDSKTEVVTATELSTETIVKPTSAPFLATQNPVASGSGPDLQQQLLLAQLQQQLLNQQLLSQVNLDPEAAENVEQTQKPDSVSTSVVTVFVSGSKPGDFTRIVSTVTLNGEEEQERYKRDLEPSPVLPIVKTQAPNLNPSL